MNLQQTTAYGGARLLDFLKIPPPNCPPPPTEMKVPPPFRNPPVPLLTEKHETRLDESQYDEPGLPSDTHQCAGIGTLSAARDLSERLPYSIGNYEISTSQQIRSTTSSNMRNPRVIASESRSIVEEQLRNSLWDDETRRMLVQNPETGSFYVPTSSGGPAIYGLRRWEKEWLPLLSTMASDRAAWKRLTLVAVGASLTNNGESC